MDMIGRKCGMLTVVEKVGSRKKKVYWLCVCACGGDTELSTGCLNSGTVKSCGCLRHRPSIRRLDLTGGVFGRLTVVSESKLTDKKSVRWDCVCSCGRTAVVCTRDLQSGHTKSCGCFKIDTVTKHGLTRHPLRSVWKDMKRRCNNTKCRSYTDYGARGITVCKEWQEDLVAFHDWAVTNGWRRGLRIDRRNNDGNYEPNNCRFISHQENCQNTRLLSRKNTSGYRGVSKMNNGKFQAYYTYKRKTVSLGANFESAKEAAIARDSAIIAAGVKLPLNFPGPN